MTLHASAFLALWLLFTLIFIIFLFLTLNALGNQNKYKFKLTVALTALILGLVSFVGIFTDQSLYQNTKNNLSIKDKLPFLNNKDKSKPSSDSTVVLDSKREFTHDEIEAKGYESVYAYFPLKFKPTTASGKSKKSDAEKLTVGKDIKPGYYRISVEGDPPYGTIEIFNPFGEVAEFAHLTKSETPKSLTTYLVKGHTLKLNSAKKKYKTTYSIAPEKHIMRNTLTAGTYIVGTDVKPGRYQIASEKSGNFIVQMQKKRRFELKYNELLEQDFTKSVTLGNGDMVYIKGEATVKLTRQ
ncbi:hypothetical protein [Staphylococcus simulans]|uniref:hypothetical protein n=1 Tax=Staphylococcus simulans TaxID=1286 RepID=UPI003F7E0182